MVNVLQIIQEYLKEEGYDGLYQQERCACKTENIAPCSELNADCKA